MNKTTLRAWHLTLPLALLLAGMPAEGLVIHRLGGDQLEPPPETGESSVEFTQLAWEEFDPLSGAETRDVAVSPQAISALRRDPEFNLAPTAEENGGSWIRPSFNWQVWDGDPSTVWETPPYLCSKLLAYWYFCEDDFGNPGTANIILPGLFQIDRVRVISGLDDASKTVQMLRVFVGFDEPYKGRASHIHPGPYLPYIAEVRDNREQVLDIVIPPHGEVGFLQIALAEHRDDWAVHDIHVYAKGFVDQSIYVSNIIDFGQPMAWGELGWSGSKGDKAKVVIQTRSGTDANPTRYWRYTGRGSEVGEVTAAEYGSLAPGEKAETTFDHKNWSFWSAYEFGDSLGTQIVSPSPRRYFQFRVDFLPREQDGAEIRVLEFRASEPLARGLVGEVWPVVAQVGEETDFTYALKPTIAAQDAGFDRLEILSTSLLGAVREVRVGDTPVQFTVERQDTHHVALGIPRMLAVDSGALVEVDFKARVLRYGTNFDVRVADSERPLEVPQGANAGDATGEYEGNRVAVATATREQNLLQVRVEPAVFTPNGDGANDEITLAYDVLEVTGRMKVRAEILDLSGRLVRQLLNEAQDIGSYERHWNGRDTGGRLLPPGIYLAVVSAETDGSTIRQVSVVHLVY
jgi:hypothetical protein